MVATGPSKHPETAHITGLHEVQTRQNLFDRRGLTPPLIPYLRTTPPSPQLGRVLTTDLGTKLPTLHDFPDSQHNAQPDDRNHRKDR